LYFRRPYYGSGDY